MGGVAACVLDSDSNEPLTIESKLMIRGHAEELIPLLSRVIAPVEKRFSSISRVAVTVGPGSYTGMRVGISAARAIARVHAIPIVGISTLSALAASLIVESKATCVASVLDARHGYYYFQLSAVTGKLLVPPAKIIETELFRLLGNEPVDLVGQFDTAFAERVRARGVRLVHIKQVNMPEIIQVARLACLADASSASVKPMYLASADVKLPSSSQRFPATVRGVGM